MFLFAILNYILFIRSFGTEGFLFISGSRMCFVREWRWTDR